MWLLCFVFFFFFYHINKEGDTSDNFSVTCLLFNSEVLLHCFNTPLLWPLEQYFANHNFSVFYFKLFSFHLPLSTPPYSLIFPLTFPFWKTLITFMTLIIICRWKTQIITMNPWPLFEFQIYKSKYLLDSLQITVCILILIMYTVGHITFSPTY